ncbi:MAG: hypothetical protein K2W96_20375 [Gemmataceae bacterium]|nr:hypothetical protein [Gemmataceae bacterium]
MMPHPTANGLTLCDYVIFENRTLKLTTVGAFGGIAQARIPGVALPFSVVAVLTGGLEEGKVEAVLASLDTVEELMSQSGTIRFNDRLQEVNCHFRFNDCHFPIAGHYQMTLLMDGAWVAQKRFRVYQR